MSAEHRWSKFWWQDWKTDSALRMCSMAARGFWMELLCIAHEGDPYGHVIVNGRAPTPKQLGMIVGGSEKAVTAWLQELEAAGVFSRTDDGTIYSRRMIRDKAVSEAGREFGKRGGNPKLNGKSPHGISRKPTGGVNPPPQPMAITSSIKRGPNLQEAEAESEEESEEKKERALLRNGDAALPPARSGRGGISDEMWGEGRAILHRLTGQLNGQAGKQIGKFLKLANGDCATVLDAMRAAVREGPHEPIPWIVAGIQTRVAPRDRDGRLQGLGKFGTMIHDMEATWDLTTFDPEPAEVP